jgi:16S rRNA G966 N2-methylase RsmD
MFNKIEDQDRYSVHSYFGRKNWKSINYFINKYTKEGDLVLDPFMGSGSTIIESIINNRSAIGIDINPISLFIVKSTISNINTKVLKSEINNFKKNVEVDLKKIYASNNVCPKCNKILDVYSYNSKTKITTLFCDSCKKFFKFKKTPNYKYNNLKFFWYPSEFVLEDNKKIFVKDLFSERNLAASSLIYDRLSLIKNKNINLFFKFCFSANLNKSTKLNSSKDKKGWRRMNPNSFKIPADYIDFNVWYGFLNKLKLGLKLKEEINKLLANKKYELTLRLGDFLDLDIKDSSVDFILTDPPYYSEINYSKLYFLNLSWLKFKPSISSLDNINNPISFEKELLLHFKKMYRVLKKNKYLVLL